MLKGFLQNTDVDFSRPFLPDLDPLQRVFLCGRSSNCLEHGRKCTCFQSHTKEAESSKSAIDAVNQVRLEQALLAPAVIVIDSPTVYIRTSRQMELLRCCLL